MVVKIAQGNAGLNGNVGGEGVGGGVAGSLKALRGHTDHSHIDVTDSNIIGNLAVGGVGAAGANGGNGLGGGMAVAAGCTASFTASTVTWNLALGGEEGVGGGSDGQSIGGGVYVFDLGVFTYDATILIKKNHASTMYNDIRI